MLYDIDRLMMIIVYCNELKETYDVNTIETRRYARLTRGGGHHEESSSFSNEVHGLFVVKELYGRAALQIYELHDIIVVSTTC